MAEPSRGVVNLDIRELVPDWARYVPPKAPAGTPEMWLYVDDVGFGALGCCGGLVDTPNIDRIAEAGLRQPLAHHGVVLPDPVLPATVPTEDWPPMLGRIR